MSNQSIQLDALLNIKGSKTNNINGKKINAY